MDAVAIGTPNRLHAPQAIRLLKAGKHVLLEKPMALNAAEARKIEKTARDRGLCLQIGHNWRYDVEVNYLRDVIAQGTLGRIVKTKGYGIHLNWGPSGWFTEHREAGGGALIDMGVHAIDTVSYLLGDPAPRSVYAKIGTHYGSYDVDDTGVMMIEWESGTVSVVENGWWHPHMDGLEAGTQVFGTQGYGQLFPTELKLSVGTVPGSFGPSSRHGPTTVIRKCTTARWMPLYRPSSTEDHRNPMAPTASRSCGSSTPATTRRLRKSGEAHVDPGRLQREQHRRCG